MSSLHTTVSAPANLICSARCEGEWAVHVAGNKRASGADSWQGTATRRCAPAASHLRHRAVCVVRVEGDGAEALPLVRHLHVLRHSEQGQEEGTRGGEQVGRGMESGRGELHWSHTAEMKDEGCTFQAARQYAVLAAPQWGGGQQGASRQHGQVGFEATANVKSGLAYGDPQKKRHGENGRKGGRKRWKVTELTREGGDSDREG